MFESLKTLVLICFKGSLDLIIGSTTAALISTMFPPMDKDMSLPRLISEIFLQNSATLVFGLEARSLFFSEEDAMSSPYGIAFMMSLYLQQGFFDKIFALQKKITEAVYEHSDPGSS